MSNKQKMKTSDLTGLALDWAVAKCEGVETIVLAGLLHSREVVRSDAVVIPVLAYSTNWAQGGPIIERERIELRDFGGEEWTADNNVGRQTFGSTPLIAAMRCYVASKLGENIEIPEELK